MFVKIYGREIDFETAWNDKYRKSFNDVLNAYFEMGGRCAVCMMKHARLAEIHGEYEVPPEHKDYIGK